MPLTDVPTTNCDIIDERRSPDKKTRRVAGFQVEAFKLAVFQLVVLRRHQRYMVNPQRVATSFCNPDLVMIVAMDSNAHWRHFRGFRGFETTALFATTRFRITTSTTAYCSRIVGVVTVEMIIDGQQLIEIMLIRPLAIGVIGVIHAGLLAAAIFTGMPEPENMTDFLTHDVIFE